MIPRPCASRRVARTSRTPLLPRGPPCPPPRRPPNPSSACSPCSPRSRARSASDALRERTEAFAPQQRVRRRELDLLWADFANHQRELRVVAKELERLGWRSIDEFPWHIALQDERGAVLAESALERTVFVVRTPRAG